MALVALLGSPAVARGQQCLEQCNLSSPGTVDCCSVEPCFQQPCSFYLGCRAEAQDALAECIASEPTCQPTSAGRCTIVLGCVRDCQREYRGDLKRCRREAFKDMPACGCGLGARGQKQAAQACRACSPAPSTTTTSTTTVTTTSNTTTTAGGSTTTVVTTTTTSTTAGGDEGATCEKPDMAPCEAACLYRIDSLRECYRDCRHACEGNVCANRICRQFCRDSVCEAIKARCTNRSVVEADPEYLSCCKNKDSCLEPDESPCRITTTTTSTTSSTMTTATPTTTNTTTTTSAQPI
jgi:hypothetical protein